MIKAIKLVRWKWVTVVTAVLIVALAAGIATGTLQMEGITAQERTSNTIEDSNVVDAATMISSANMAPVTSTSIFEEATLQRLAPATSAGSSVQPTSGEYLYLPFIDRYYSLPDDVELVETIQLGTCAPENAADVCPVMPSIFLKGERPR